MATPLSTSYSLKSIKIVLGWVESAIQSIGLTWKHSTISDVVGSNRRKGKRDLDTVESMNIGTLAQPRSWLEGEERSCSHWWGRCFFEPLKECPGSRLYCYVLSLYVQKRFALYCTRHNCHDLVITKCYIGTELNYL